MYEAPALVAYPTGENTYDVHQSLSGGLELVEPLRADVRGDIDFGDRLERGAFADDPSSRGGVEQRLREQTRGQRNPDRFTLPGGISAERLLHPDPLLTDVTLQQMAQNISYVSFVVLYVVGDDDVTVYAPTPTSIYFVRGLLRADVQVKAWPREDAPTHPERFLEFALSEDAPIELDSDSILPTIRAESKGDAYEVLRDVHTHIYGKLVEEQVQPGQPLRYASLADKWRLVALADDATPLLEFAEQNVKHGYFVEFPLNDEMDSEDYEDWSWDIQHHREFAGDLRLEYGADLVELVELDPQPSSVSVENVRDEASSLQQACLSDLRDEYGDRMTRFTDDAHE